MLKIVISFMEPRIKFYIPKSQAVRILWLVNLILFCRNRTTYCLRTWKYVESFYINDVRKEWS